MEWSILPFNMHACILAKIFLHDMCKIKIFIERIRPLLYKYSEFLSTYSGTSLNRPPLGPVKVSLLEGWPHFRGEFVLKSILWDFSSGLNTGVATFQGS